MFNIKDIQVGALETNCYIVNTEEACIVIDPGEEEKRLEEYLDSNNLTPSYIFLTHGHFDHIGAVKYLQNRYHATVLVGELDSEMLLETRKSLAVFMGGTEEKFVIEKHKTVRDGDIINIGDLKVEVITTPGHTKGGVTYKIGDNLFVGDTLFLGGAGRTDLYGGDFTSLKISIDKLAATNPNADVFPGHGPSTTMQSEIKNNSYVGTNAYDNH